MSQDVIAKLNYLRIAPRKVRLIAGTLKGLSAIEAEAQLLFRPQRSSKPLLNLLRSAMANAKNNYKLNPEKLQVKNIIVNQGPMLKRFLPRAMGRATPIQKKTSHITLTLVESSRLSPSRFLISKPVKVKKSKETALTKAKKEVKAAPAAVEAVKPKEGGGFLRRIFRRKSI